MAIGKFSLQNIKNFLDRDKELPGFQLAKGGLVSSARKATEGFVKPFYQPNFQQAPIRSTLGAPARFLRGYGQNIAESATSAGKTLEERQRLINERTKGLSFKERLQPKSLLGNKEENKKLLYGGYQSAKTLAQLSPGRFGGIKSAPQVALTGGLPSLLSGTIGAVQGKDFATSAGKGFGEGLGLRPVTRYTDPVINRVANMFAPQAGFLTRQLGQRGVTGVGNVIEDEIIGALGGYKPQGVDRAISFGIGFAAGGNEDLLKKMRGELINNGVKPEKADQIVENVKTKTEQFRDTQGRYAIKGQTPEVSKIEKLARDPNTVLADLSPSVRKQVNDFRFENMGTSAGTPLSQVRGPGRLERFLGPERYKALKEQGQSGFIRLGGETDVPKTKEYFADVLKESQTVEEAQFNLRNLVEDISTRGDKKEFQALKQAIGDYKKLLVTGPGMPRDPMAESLLSEIEKLQATNIKDFEFAPKEKIEVEQPTKLETPKFEETVKVESPMGDMVKVPKSSVKTNLIDTKQPILKSSKAKLSNTFDESLGKLLGKQEAAQTTATQKALNYSKINPEIAQEVIDFSQGVRTDVSPEAKAWSQKLKTEYNTLYDELISTAKKAGMDTKEIGKVEDYMPQFWKESLQEAEQLPTFKSALGGKGATKQKIYSSYQEGLQAGLTPRFTHPAQILEQYVKNLERFKANVDFVNEMKSAGLLKTAKQAEKLAGYSPILAPGLTKPGASLYAPADLAREINQVFSPQVQGSFEKGLSKLANLSKLTQEIGLSGGAPGSPVNAFALGQMVKNITAFSPTRSIKSFVLAFDKNKAGQYFIENSNFIKELQQEQVPITTEFKIENFIKQKAAKKLFGEKIAESWGKLMNDPTFSRLMPIDQIEFYKEIRFKAMQAGLPEDQSIKIASKAVKNFWGLTDMVKEAKRTQVQKDVVSTLFFAPKFRESMVNFWVNNIKALKNPLALENINNTKYLIGATMSLVGMNLAQKALTGKFMFENPDGKETTLLIPAGDTTIGIPFAPSVGTLPRMVGSIGSKLGKADFKGALLEGRNTLSMALKPVVDIMANKDYFGRDIVKETDTPAEKLKKQKDFLIKSAPGLNHPYIKQAYEMVTSDEKVPVWQRLSMAMEMPIRYYNTDSIKNAEFWNKYNDLKKINDRYESLKYSNKDAAIQLLKDNEEKINEFNLMKGYVKEYFVQKESGKTPTALQEYKGDQVSTQSNELIKNRISLGDETLTGQEVAQYYMRDYERKADTRFGETTRKQKLIARLNDLDANENLTEEQKVSAEKEMLKSLGANQEDYEYYKVAKTNQDARTSFVLDYLEGGNIKDRKELIGFLANGRKEVFNKQLVTSGLLDELVDIGLISNSEAKMLKKFSFSYDKAGNLVPSVKTTGRGANSKLKKITLSKPKAAPKISPTKISLEGINKPIRVKMQAPDLSQMRIPTTQSKNYAGKAAEAVSRISTQPKYNL